MKLILLLVVAVILFGSWFPFRFEVPVAFPGWGFLVHWSDSSRRGDVLLNLLLYVPVGFFWPLALGLRGRVWPIVTAAMAGAALSITVEVIQILIPGRVTSGVDVLCNSTGAAIGAFAALLVGGNRRLDVRRAGGTLPLFQPFSLFPLLLAAAWLGHRLFPFVPTIDWQKFKNALKPLLLDPSVGAVDLARYTVGWLVFGRLLAALLPARRTGALLALIGGFVLLAKIPIVQQSVVPDEVIGIGIAALAWAALGDRLIRRPALLAALIGGVIAANALLPFTLRSAPTSFHWLPFYGFLGGSIEINIRSFLEKFFTYGALLWLLVQARVRLLPAALVLAALMLALEAAQTMLVGRTPEITDALIVLLIAVVIRSLADSPRQAAL